MGLGVANLLATTRARWNIPQPLIVSLVVAGFHHKARGASKEAEEDVDTNHNGNYPTNLVVGIVRVQVRSLAIIDHAHK